MTLIDQQDRYTQSGSAADIAGAIEIWNRLRAGESLPGFGYCIVGVRTVDIVHETSKKVAHFYTLHLRTPWFDALEVDTIERLASSLAGIVETATQMQEFARLSSKQKESALVRHAHYTKAAVHRDRIAKLAKSIEDGLRPRYLTSADVERCDHSARNIVRPRGRAQ